MSRRCIIFEGSNYNLRLRGIKSDMFLMIYLLEPPEPRKNIVNIEFDLALP